MIPVDPAEVTWQAFRHFLHLDEANAAIHCAPTRYSPLTFRLAEVLSVLYWPMDRGGPRDVAVLQVMGDHGAYEEDKGR